MNNTIIIEGKPVSFESRINPTKEALHYVEAAELEKTDVLVLFALTTVSILTKLLEKAAILKRDILIVCVDPDNQLWNILKETPEGLSLLDRKEIRFTDLTSLVTPENIIENKYYTDAPSSFKYKILKNPGIVAHLENKFKDMEERIVSLFRTLYSNMLITNKFRKTWERNISKNRKAASRCFTPLSYKNVFKNEPVLVINAGPSLDSAMDVLRKTRKRFRMICVDTALKACVKNGVMPDIVVSLDCQLDNVRDFLGIKVEEADLFMEVSTQPHIKNFFKGRVFLFHTKKQIRSLETGNEEDFVEPHYREFTQNFRNSVGFQTGGSVSATALDIALYTGASRIVFVGQDLGYASGQIYCRGTYVEDVRMKQCNKFRTYDTMLARYAYKFSSSTKVIFEGKSWHSTPIMDQYRRWFEDAASLLQGKLQFFKQPFIKEWIITEEDLHVFPVLPSKKPQALPFIPATS